MKDVSSECIEQYAVTLLARIWSELGPADFSSVVMATQEEPGEAVWTAARYEEGANEWAEDAINEHAPEPVDFESDSGVRILHRTWNRVHNIILGIHPQLACDWHNAAAARKGREVT